PLLPRRQAGQTRPPAHPLTVAEFQSSPRAPRQVRVAVLVARYNEAVTSRLLAGARRCLQEKGVADARVAVIWAPGALARPAAACPRSGGRPAPRLRGARPWGSPAPARASRAGCWAGLAAGGRGGGRGAAGGAGAGCRGRSGCGGPRVPRRPAARTPPGPR